MSATHLRPSARLAAIAACAVVSTFGVAASASATCTPAAAWSDTVVTPAVPAVGTPTVTAPNPGFVPAVPGSPAVDEVSHIVHHTAVGEPTVEVPNPDYVPAVPGTPEVQEVSHVVQHPAEYVHHDAVTHVEYHFVKFTQTRSGVKVYGEIQWGAWSDWSEWTPETHTSWQLTTDAIGQPAPHASWAEGHGKNKVYFERVWQARFDGDTRTVTDKAAWVEKTRDEWTETVVDTPYQAAVPGTPAVGEPTITIENPDYLPAWDEVVIDSPAIPAVPAVPAIGAPTIDIPNPGYIPAVAERTDTVEHEAVICQTATVQRELTHGDIGKQTLAQTGGELDPWLFGLAGLLLAGGATCMVGMGATKRNRSGR